MSGANFSLDRDPIKVESRVHGRRWQTLHGGYFSDAAVAAPFIGIIKSAIDISRPDVIVDLGGGTGFILDELIKQSIAPSIRLVNLDLSRKQLDAAGDTRIFQVHKSMAEFVRADAGDKSARFLFIMRSALHYSSRNDLMPLLRHLNSQTRRGEFFVHQTACFDSIRDARCLNRLYEHMATNKWYPTTKYLSRSLEKAGWSIASVLPAPVLPLTSNDLGKRYRLRKYHLAEIRDAVLRRFGEKENIFTLTPEGFRACLHYRILTCVAR